ncbi:hypothetical protein C8J56DRAFT_1028096 [Mycena floridula]|nr:hypothetical protein C8J56DRAFT_1028096 [Mycena floridula]
MTKYRRCPARGSYHLWRYQNVFQIAPSESHLGKLTWSLFTYTSITTLSLGCPNWYMNGSVLPREHPSWRLEVSGYNDKEPQEILGKTSYPLFRCESSVEISCQGVRQWKNSRKLHLSIGFSAHNFSGETRMSAVKGYAFWGQLNSLYESDGLRFQVVLEVCKRRIDPVIEYDRVHGLLIVKELPYLRARGRLALLPVSQISSGQGGRYSTTLPLRNGQSYDFPETFSKMVPRAGIRHTSFPEPSCPPLIYPVQWQKAQASGPQQMVHHYGVRLGEDVDLGLAVQNGLAASREVH